MGLTLAATGTRPILVPVDFSPASREALLFALQMAGCSSQVLNILHVVHDGPGRPGIYPRNGKTDQILPIEDIGRNLLQDFITGIRQQHPDNTILPDAGTIVVTGLPATRIPEIANRTGAGLIVMGNNGRPGLARLLAGSVSQKVARQSPVPVIIVHANGTVRKAGNNDTHDQGGINTPPDGGVKLHLVS